ncbi:MAG: hypothetical protein K2J20_00995 [Bacilli bacterium]|nr:hypothetical protein [Bacilli bacterium]
MKKLIIILSCLFLAVGCGCMNDKAADAVEKYLNDYKGLTDDVLSSVDELVSKENLNDTQRDTYKEVIKREYKDLMYTIENEDYDGDTAKVTVKITVYDLYKAQTNASTYLTEHQDEFLTDGAYDANKYLDYKLEQMKNFNETVSYTIVIKTIKVDGKWQVEQPDNEVLEKIHGIYNYEQE